MATVKHKNIGSFLAFNKDWFAKNQQALLWLLNNKLTSRWFKWVLRIRKEDIGYDSQIISIAPNHYVVSGERIGEFVVDFRSHPKFGKRIYHAFKPLWWGIHFYDWIFADRFAPQWSYGFDTLTAYPDPDIEVTTVDGWVGHSANDTYANLRAAAGNFANDSSPSGSFAELQSTASVDEYDVLQRGIFLFDTSTIDDLATISSAVFSLFGNTVGNNLGSHGIGVVSSNPSSNTALANGDYTSLGTTRYASDISIASWSVIGYNDFTFNATGLANVSKTGLTKLGTRLSLDIDNTTPTWSASVRCRAGGGYADNVGTVADPKLVVTYTVGSPSSSVSASVSPSASISPSSSASASVSPSSSSSASVSPSSSSSASMSPSASVSPSSSISSSPSASISPSPSASPSPSSSSSASLSPSSSISPSSSVSPSPSMSFTEWTNQERNSASWANQAKNSASWVNQEKNTTNWTNQDRSF